MHPPPLTNRQTPNLANFRGEGGTHILYSSEPAARHARPLPLASVRIGVGGSMVVPLPRHKPSTPAAVVARDRVTVVVRIGSLPRGMRKPGSSSAPSDVVAATSTAGLVLAIHGRGSGKKKSLVKVVRPEAANVAVPVAVAAEAVVVVVL